MLKLFLLFALYQFSFLAIGQEGAENLPTQISDDPDLNELIEKREKTQELMEKINPNSEEKVVDEKVHPLIQIQQLGYPEVNFKALNDPRVQSILDKALRDGLIANIPADAIRNTILEKLNGNPIQTFLQKYPIVLDKFIEILRDREALPGLLKILTKKDDLKMYLTIWIIILIVTLWLKKTLLAKQAKWNFIQRFLIRNSLNLISLTASMLTFYSLFQDELAPTLKILGII